MRRSKLLGTIAASILLVFSGSASAADIVLFNLDGPGVGLNDPTPAAPVGGNPGMTVGDQRINVYVAAAQQLGNLLESDAPIYVGASFTPLSCGPTGGVLGAAGATYIFRDLPELPEPATWYHSALADALAGVDLVLELGGFIDIDIISFFNANLGTPGCLENSGWYYGLDNNQGATEIDFLAVVTHEIIHGLGHSEFVSEASGARFSGFNDIYMINMLDTTTGQGWGDMTDAERLASQVNSGNLVWSGDSVTDYADQVLGPRPSLKVWNPKSSRGSFEAQGASYGPQLTFKAKTRRFVLVDDGVGTSTDGCEPIQNVDKVAGMYALIDRGGCAFTTKSANAQAAGAIGAIVINNQPTGLPPMGGSDNSITIPSVGITMELGAALKDAATQRRYSLASGRPVLDKNFLAGTQDGFVRLYAPNPVAPGSSKSHWDTTATPNLLMEPFISSDLASAIFLDLTPNQFEDIGWTLQ